MNWRPDSPAPCPKCIGLCGTVYHPIDRPCTLIPARSANDLLRDGLIWHGQMVLRQTPRRELYRFDVI